MLFPTVRCYLRADGPLLPPKLQEDLLTISRRFGASSGRFVHGQEGNADEFWLSPPLVEQTFDGERALETMVQMLEEVTCILHQSWHGIQLVYTVLLVFECLSDRSAPGLEISADLLGKLAQFNVAFELDIQT